MQVQFHLRWFLCLSIVFQLSLTAVHAQARTLWTTSRIHGSPEPPKPYTVQRIYPHLQFKQPLDVAVEPGTGRWFILQHDGKLLAFDPLLPDSEPVLVHDAHVDFKNHARSYGFEFHPNYAVNKQLFLSYIAPDNADGGTHLSRFEMRDGKVDSSSETLLLTWPSGGHNGACLKFGPDGFLYISTGDGSGPFPPDSHDVGQDIGDLRSTILRIDVDHPGETAPYSIPADNPFIDTPGARPEVWAFGFRNPWKMSFAPGTDDLWVGDVGWELWELVFRVQKGGNYGWSIREGRQPIRTDLQQGPGDIIPPIADHDHTEARSITGGFVCTSDRIPELNGAYIYGDYVTGKIWGLKADQDVVTWQQELTDTSLAIVSFGVDQTGDLVVLDYAGGLHRLIPNPAINSSNLFPHKLSETGLFSSTPDHIPSPGVLPYQMNATMWMDGATAECFVAIPSEDSIQIHNNKEHWKYPVDTVFAKTISAEVVHEGLRSKQRLETQVLHYDGIDWNAYTYLWNAGQTDAELVGRQGTTQVVNMYQRAGTPVEVTRRIHSRAECLTCHTPRAGNSIGFDPVNLKQLTTENEQLQALTDVGVFNKLPTVDLAMSSPDDEHAILSGRARSYLAINCAHCHRREGGGTAQIELPFSLKNINAIDVSATQGTFGIPGGKIISAGNPYASVLYYRMATVGRGRMPQLGTHFVDHKGLALIHDWIKGLKAMESVPLDERDMLACTDLLNHSISSERWLEAEQRLYQSTPATLHLSKCLESLPPSASHEFAQVLANGSPAHLRGLFERFLPESERLQTLGNTVDPKLILAMQGDIERGSVLFHKTEGISCRNCHKIGETGKSVGADLSNIGAQRTIEQILESILEPSRVIDPKYSTYSVETTTGKILTGLIVERNDEQVKLRDVAGQEIVIPAEEIELLQAQPKSLMPDLLVKDLSAQDLADILAYLCSLKSEQIRN